MEQFDVAVIGGGPGGYVAAIRAAQLNLKTALVEKNERLGGTCLNVGCIPSKALLESSEHFHFAQTHFETLGLKTEGLSFDLAAIMARKEKIVAELTGGILQLMKKNKITVFRGHGRMKTARILEIARTDSTEEIEAKQIILAPGSLPVELPFLPFDGRRVVSSTDALSFTEVPRRLAVIGAGAIGLELGSVWRRFGAEVTVVELLPRIAAGADGQISQMLERSLKAQGILFHLQTKLIKADLAESGVTLTLQDAKGAEKTLPADTLLVSVGRRPNTADLNLAGIGIAVNPKGQIEVDEQFETNVPGVFAIGDAIRGPMLAHKAMEEGAALAERIAGHLATLPTWAIPGVIYTDPELAQVGLTEEEAKNQGLSFKTGKFYFKANGRAKTMEKADGLIKVLAEVPSDRILGVHMVGPHVSELIASATLAIQNRLTVRQVQGTVHAHPTLSEAFKEAALAATGSAIHG